MCACCCNDEDWIVFCLLFVVFFDLGFRLVLVECSELFFSTFFLMTENELKMQIAPFGAAVFGVCSRLWATNLLEMLNFDLFAAAAAETLLPARADVRFTSHFTEKNKRLRNKET